MSTHTFFRKADVSKAKAVETLLQRHPGAKVVGEVRTKRATPAEARFASVRPGERIYEATIKLAEGDPLDLSSDEPKDEPEESAAPPKAEGEKSGDSSDDKEPDSDSDDSGGDSDPLGLGDGGDVKPPSAEDRIADALDRIADALSGGAGADLGMGGPGGPDMGAPPPGPDAGMMPDVGAPAPGEALPPPVKPKGPPGGPSFASVIQRVASSGEAELVRRDVTGQVTTTQIIREAESNFPTHKVGRVRRNGIHEIKGTMVDLPAHKIALVTLVRK